MTRLIILPPAVRYLKKIKDKALKTAFQNTIDALLSDPLIGDAKTGDLAGVFCCDIYYNKTNCELAYTLIEENGETVVIILAGTRENFYQELKRYMKNNRD